MKLSNFLFTALLLVISFVLGGFYFQDYVYSFISSNTKLSNHLETNSLQRVYNFLKEEYLYPDKMNDKSSAEIGATKGLVESLEDPYTVYFSKDEYKSFSESLDGKFEGIGAEIGIKDGQLIIITPIIGNPASKAGLLAGDAIITINGESTFDTSVEAAVTKIRGEKGTEVKLEIAREGQTEIKEFVIVRDIIDVPNIKVTEKDGVGIISLAQFQVDTAQELDQEILKFKEKDIKNIVLDLRNNPGGYLQAAVEVVELFTPKGSIAVIEKGRDSNMMTELKTKRAPKYEDIKLVILVNQGSASASEIVAGALRDLKDIELVGQKTFGKGLVQSTKEFSDGSVLKYTIAEWFTPSGNALNKEGIKPDFEVELTSEDIQADKDPQIDKAIERIKAK
ncbi:MAG: S41 family peptidase [Minisyncoccia bacterium]